MANLKDVASSASEKSSSSVDYEDANGRYKKNESIYWRSRLDDVDIRTAQPNRTCEFLIMVESVITCSDVIDKFIEGCNLDAENPVRAISKDIIYQICNNFPETECVGFKYADLYKFACDEANPLTKKQKDIPVDLQARLIKLTALFFMFCDYKIQENRAKEMLKSENKFQRVLKADKTSGIPSGDVAKNKRKGKEKKSKKKPKNKGAKKEKKIVIKGLSKSAPQINVSGESCNFLKQTLSDTKNYITNEPAAEQKHIYFIVCGFYNADIIKELNNIKVTTAAVVEVARSEDTLVDPSVIPEYKTRFSYDSEYISAIFAHRMPSEELEEDLLVRSGPIEFIKPREVLIFEFWTKAYKLFEGNEQYSYLENTYHTQYVPRNLKEVAKYSNAYRHQCAQIFSDVCDFIQTIPDTRKQHTNYVNHMRLIKLGKPQERLNVESMNTYNRRMRYVPPECFSIHLLLDSLLEEVYNREERMKLLNVRRTRASRSFLKKNSDSSSSNWSVKPKSRPVNKITKITSSINLQREAFQATLEENFIPIESESTIINNMSELYYQFAPLNTLEFHTAARDHILTIFKRYKSRYIPFHKKRIKSKTVIYSPAVINKINTDPFLVHEGNKIELKVNHYKGLKEFLFNLNMEFLKRSPPANLWDLYSRHSRLEKLMERFGRDKWPNLGYISNEDFHLCLELYTLSTVRCQDDRVREKPFCDIQINFPNRRDAALATNRYPKQTFAGEVLKRSTRYPEFEPGPNFYENLKLPEFTIKEPLPACVFLQEITSQYNKYRCMDYLYSSLMDNLLIRFHDNMDEFGCVTDIWSQNLRTPVCLRDFCKYIMNEDTKWIELEQERHFFERFIMNDIISNCFESTLSIQDPVFTNFSYLLAGSLKEQWMKQCQVAIDSMQGMNTATKKTSTSEYQDETIHVIKAPGKKESLASFYDPLPLPTMTPVHRCARPGEPYNFIGYDLGTNRVQLTGGATTFLSLDGIKAVVDTTSFMGQPPKLSLSLSVNDHSLIYHHDYKKKDCLFHLALSDGTFVVFAKPEQKVPMRYNICENVIGLTNGEEHFFPMSAFKEQPKLLYQVTETHQYNLKCFNVPYTAKRSFLVPENAIKKMYIKLRSLKRKKDDRLFIRDTSGVNFIINPSEEEIPAQTQAQAQEIPAYTTEESETSTPKKSGVKKRIPEASTSANSTAMEEEQESLYTPEQNAKQILLSYLRNAKISNMPIFKVCTSKLHGHDYIKRVKSYVTIPIGGIIKRIGFKPKMKRVKRIIEVKKCFPMDVPKLSTPKLPYDVRITMPSGLHLRTEADIDDKPNFIKQYYFEKGPQCRDIDDEDSRTYLRNGCLAIKKFDGTTTVLTPGGTIIKYDLPCLKETRKPKPQYIFQNPTLFGEAGLPKNSRIYKKAWKQTLKRRIKHLIDGPESLNRKSRCCYQRNIKKYMLPKQMYLTESGFPQYTVITRDGRKVKRIKGDVVEEKKYFTATENDLEKEECYYEREDGTHSIYTKDGTRIVQFPDGTRISTWAQIELEADDILEESMEEEKVEEEESKIQEEEEVIEEEIEEEEEEEEENLGSDVRSFDSEHHHLSDDCSLTFTYAPINPNKMHIAFPDPSEYENFRRTFEWTVDGNNFFDFAPEEEPPSEESFTKEKEDGWVIVNLFHEFEHPNFATVLYGAINNHLRVVLPGNIVLESKGGNSFFLDIDKHVKTLVERDGVKITSTMCLDCQGQSESIFYVGPVYHDAPIDVGTQLLKIEDTYDKIFEADYMGNCRKNIDFIRTGVNKYRCERHRVYPAQQLFTMNRDYSGTHFWTEKMYQNKVDDAEEDKEVLLNRFGRSKRDFTVTEIQTIKEEHPHNKYLIPYQYPKLSLTKYRVDEKGIEKDLAYIMYRCLHLLPHQALSEPLFDIINKLKDAHENAYGREVDLTAVLNSLNEEHMKFFKQISVDEVESVKELRTRSVCIDDDVRHVVSRRERWENWKVECEKQEEEIKSGYIPPYFESEISKLPDYKLPDNDFFGRITPMSLLAFSAEEDKDATTSTSGLDYVIKPTETDSDEDLKKIMQRLVFEGTFKETKRGTNVVSRKPKQPPIKEYPNIEVSSESESDTEYVPHSYPTIPDTQFTSSTDLDKPKKHPIPEELQYAYSNYMYDPYQHSISNTNEVTPPESIFGDKTKTESSSMVTIIEVQKMLTAGLALDDLHTKYYDENATDFPNASNLSLKSEFSSDITIDRVKQKIQYPYTTEIGKCQECVKTCEKVTSNKSVLSKDSLEEVRIERDSIDSSVDVDDLSEKDPSITPFAGSLYDEDSLKSNISFQASGSLKGHFSTASINKRNEDLVKMPLVQRIYEKPGEPYVPLFATEPKQPDLPQRKPSEYEDVNVTLEDIGPFTREMTASMIVNYDDDSLKDEAVNKLSCREEKPKTDVDISLNLILDYESVADDIVTDYCERAGNNGEDKKNSQNNQH